MTLRQQQEYLICNRIFPFLPYFCLHSPIAINRITKPFMTFRQQQEYLVRNRKFPFLPYFCLHSPIATNRITKPNAAYSPTNVKTADMISRACRLILSISRCQTALQSQIIAIHGNPLHTIFRFALLLTNHTP